MDIALPDYDNSLLALISTILRRYGCMCVYKSLPELDETLGGVIKTSL
jgi:hypothetical protein